MHWRSATANHCAIYLGEATYLHQPNMKLSEQWTMNNEESLLSRWAVSFWRHKERLMDAS
jgi:cell wall-associated NlpC family hydrolase